MTAALQIQAKPTARQMISIGCVSYLNAKPLIYGLDQQPQLQMTLDVPANLIDGLRDQRFDVALLPIIDYQRLLNLRIITSGGIGCDGPTLTVRIFSRSPIEQIQSLACDIDSHTSVALARVILAEAFGIHPELVPFDHAHNQPGQAEHQAMLLIGDKVVCDQPAGYPYQLDLGEAWKRHTGLPFVFAAWVARAGVDLGSLAEVLLQSKMAGMDHLDEIVTQHAVPRGWPADLARRYMTEFLKYDVGDRQLQAIQLFHELALKHGMLAGPLQKLRVA